MGRILGNLWRDSVNVEIIRYQSTSPPPHSKWVLMAANNNRRTHFLAVAISHGRQWGDLYSILHYEAPPRGNNVGASVGEGMQPLTLHTSRDFTITYPQSINLDQTAKKTRTVTSSTQAKAPPAFTQNQHYHLPRITLATPQNPDYVRVIPNSHTHRPQHPSYSHAPNNHPSHRPP